MLASTALVLFMTIPGLALYYGGMVRKENVLATVMQIFTITCLITALWLFFGYSLSFAPADPASSGGNMIYGDGSRIWLQGMTVYSVNQMAPNIPETLFCAYQLTFAIITPCLIVGAFADRMKYIPMIIFMACWHLIVYCPTAHAVWHPSGFLKKENVLDFAGGNVVHISAGVSGLISSIVIGKRIGYDENRFEPHNILYTAVGVCMLWVGWYGFNAGSAVGANQIACYALINTQIATYICIFLDDCRIIFQRKAKCTWNGEWCRRGSRMHHTSLRLCCANRIILYRADRWSCVLFWRTNQALLWI